MRVLFFFPTLLFAFNLFGQDFCIPGVPSDEPPGCIPCPSVYLTLPSGDSVAINVMGFNSDSLTQDTSQYDFPCGTIEKGAWFTYYANQDGALSFSFFLNQCFDSFSVDLNALVEIGLYDKDLNLITCRLTDSVFTHSGMSPGQEVRILMDAKSTGSCQIFLQFHYPQISNSFNLEPSSKIFASAETDAFCLTEEVCFKIDPVDGATNYDWVPPKNATVISNGQGIPNEICVRFESIGLDTIRVTPYNPCNQGQSVIRTFGVYDFNDQSGQITSQSGSIFCEGSSVCFEFQPNDPQTEFVWNIPENFEIQQGGDTSELTICGQVLDFGNGMVEMGVRPLDGCNQTILRIPIHPDIPTTVLPTIRVCEENFPVEVEGQLFEQTGNFSVVKPNVNGCDSVISFRIRLEVPPTGFYNEFICPEATCIQIGDSCYALTPSIVLVDRPYPLYFSIGHCWN